jgi:hypothetical protein
MNPGPIGSENVQYGTTVGRGSGCLPLCHSPKMEVVKGQHPASTGPLSSLFSQPASDPTGGHREYHTGSQKPVFALEARINFC